MACGKQSGSQTQKLGSKRRSPNRQVQDRFLLNGPLIPPFNYQNIKKIVCFSADTARQNRCQITMAHREKMAQYINTKIRWYNVIFEVRGCSRTEWIESIPSAHYSDNSLSDCFIRTHRKQFCFVVLGWNRYEP